MVLKRMTRLVLTVPPAAEPLTAADIRARLGLSSDVADTALDPLIKAARQQIDGWSGWLGRALVNQTWTMYLPAFRSVIEIPLPPLQSIASVKYIASDGNEVTLDPSDYRVVPGNPPGIEMVSSLPTAACQDDAVRVSFVAGYGPDAENVPEPIRTAIALMVSNLRSMTSRDPRLSVDAVVGVSSKSYASWESSGGALTSAVDALLSTYRVAPL